jgi:probable HAF family extracellular repeat protein
LATTSAGTRPWYLCSGISYRDVEELLAERGIEGRRTDLPVPAGEFGAAAQAVNDKGEVAGYSIGPASNSAFLWQNGRATALGTLPGSTSARAFGINNHGQVVGNTDYDAFLWHNGQMTALPGLLSTGGSAADINNLGQIVGSSATTTDGGNLHAVLWTH